jgi:hypothetical protein
MDPDDQELFNSAVSNEPAEATPPEPVVPSTAPEPAAQARDESGRFAASETNDSAEAAPAEQPGKPEPAIPPARLREEAEARRRAEADNAELRSQLRMLMERVPAPQAQPAAEPVDPVTALFENPDQWVGQHLGTVQNEVQQTREFYSRRFAEQQHGADKVQAAYQALDTAINSGKIDGAQVKATLAKSMDPYGDIMAWHGRQAAETALSSVGNDLEAYNQKIIADYLASQQQAGQSNTAPAQAGSGTIVKLPPNLNRMTSAASDNGATQDIDGQELFNSTISQRRR